MKPTGLKVLSVLGGRPHLIKAEAIHRAFAGRTDSTHLTIECWLSDLNDYPHAGSTDFDLPIPVRIVRTNSKSNLRAQLEALLRAQAPDVVLVYGDLPTTDVAADICSAMGIPFVHIESGYRSGDLSDDEEAIRIRVSHLASACIAYSANMIRNLTREGIDRSTIHTFGNPALQTLHRRLAASQAVRSSAEPTGLVTFHHDDNLDDASHLRIVTQRLAQLANGYPLCIVLFRHTADRLRAAGLMQEFDRLAGRGTLRLVPTLPYTEYIQELGRASFVVTDSSSLQDDCALLNKPCLVFRHATPRAGNLGRYTKLVPQLETTDLAAAVQAALANCGDTADTHKLLGRPYDHNFVELLQQVAYQKA